MAKSVMNNTWWVDIGSISGFLTLNLLLQIQLVSYLFETFLFLTFNFLLMSSSALMSLPSLTSQIKIPSSILDSAVGYEKQWSVLSSLVYLPRKGTSEFSD